MNYIRRHWRGELSLVQAFWINVIFLSIIINLFRIFIINQVIENPVTLLRVGLIFDFICSLFVFPWQLVGLWQTSRSYIKQHNKQLCARVVQALILICVLFFSIRVIQHYSLYKYRFVVGFMTDLSSEVYREYTLEMKNDNTFLYLEGGLGYGISKDVEKRLKKYPGIRAIVLNTGGGLAREGRNLADLISHYKLDTYCFDCYSAGTVAFIAGKKRYLIKGGYLGFHTGRPLGDSSQINSFELGYLNWKEDIYYFRRQGVTEKFCEEISNTHYDEVWIPSKEELLKAGVIHEVVDLSDIFPKMKFDNTQGDPNCVPKKRKSPIEILKDKSEKWIVED